MNENSHQPDVRWKQRLQNFIAAFSQLKLAVDLAHSRTLSDLEKQGLIQGFEFTHELAWTVLKDFFDFQGGVQINGSRDATREAFHRGMIDHGEVWMDMINSRHLSSHTYNKVVADKIVTLILRSYFPLLESLLHKLQELSKV